MKTFCKSLSIGLWFLIVHRFCDTAEAQDLTWTGSISSDWNNPTNWTPPQVPTATDHVIINSGSVTMPANGFFGAMDWSGGTINGFLTVASNAVLNISGSAEK